MPAWIADLKQAMPEHAHAWALCLFIVLAWLSVWSPFGKDENVGRIVQLVRNVLSILKSSPWWVALPVTSFWMSPIFGETTPIELAIVALQIHGTLLYSLGGWNMMLEGISLFRRVRHWLPLLDKRHILRSKHQGRWTKNALPALWLLLLEAIRHDRKV